MWTVIYALVGSVLSVLISGLFVFVMGRKLLFENDMLGFGPMLTFMGLLSLGIFVSLVLGIRKQARVAKARGKSEVLVPLLSGLIALAMLSVGSLYVLPPIPLFNPLLLLMQPILDRISERRFAKFQGGQGISPTPFRVSQIRRGAILLLPETLPASFTVGEIALGPVVKVSGDGSVDTTFALRVQAVLSSFPLPPSGQVFLRFAGELPQRDLCFCVGAVIYVFRPDGVLRHRIPLPPVYNPDKPGSVTVAENASEIVVGLQADQGKPLLKITLDDASFRFDYPDLRFAPGEPADHTFADVIYADQFAGGAYFLVIDHTGFHGEGFRYSAHILDPTGRSVWSETFRFADASHFHVSKRSLRRFVIRYPKSPREVSLRTLAESGPVDGSENDDPPTYRSDLDYRIWRPAGPDDRAVQELLKRGQIDSLAEHPDILETADGGYLVIGTTLRQNDRNYNSVVKVTPDAKIDPQFLRISPTLPTKPVMPAASPSASGLPAGSGT